jgi:plastocyanin
MSVRNMLAISALAMAACSGDGGSAAPDAASPDAPVVAVKEVPCPATPDAWFVTNGLMFSPSAATIRVGQIAKLESNSLEHPIGPFKGGDPLETDPALMVTAGRSKCFTFMRPGTFKFICSAHFYVGTLTVQ